MRIKRKKMLENSSEEVGFDDGNMSPAEESVYRVRRGDHLLPPDVSGGSSSSRHSRFLPSAVRIIRCEAKAAGEMQVNKFDDCRGAVSENDDEDIFEDDHQEANLESLVDICCQQEVQQVPLASHHRR